MLLLRDLRDGESITVSSYAKQLSSEVFANTPAFTADKFFSEVFATLHAISTVTPPLESLVYVTS
jgi:hypothetical protein